MLIRTPEESLADGAACREAALAYAARGWCPIPLCPPDHVGAGRAHGKVCQSPGKVPLVGRWTRFERLPTAQDIRQWWHAWPNANVGLVMGRISRMVGLDVDGDGGEMELLGVLANLGLAPTLEFLTPGGGRRYLFGIELELTIKIAFRARGIKQELRLLAEGSQTVAPPSRHQCGGYYLWTATEA
jgi:hypothetical protein